jgi:N-acetylneuraminate synthase/N,N'-diacetyllegionaminate synthase
MVATFFAKSFSIEDREIGEGFPCFIIAEAGVSHFGSFEKALALVDAAVDANADAVKFQIFKTSELISSFNREWTDRMRPKEMPIEAFRDIRGYCNERGITFFATAHDLGSLEELAGLDTSLYKIGSGEVKNPDFFRAVGSLGKPVIFSTGMYTREDFDESLAALVEQGCSRVAVMHCVTRYPTPPEEVNLRRILTLKDIFSGPVGYSDHCATHDIAAASVLLGANIIEKHITLEKNIPDAQDWKVSCDPAELSDFVASVRRLEATLGSGKFEPGKDEMESMKWARKSIVSKKNLPAGTLLRREHLSFKRPGLGISPDRINAVLGKILRVTVPKDAMITFDLLE